jgi:hypothetical protein
MKMNRLTFSAAIIWPPARVSRPLPPRRLQPPALLSLRTLSSSAGVDASKKRLAPPPFVGGCLPRGPEQARAAILYFQRESGREGRRGASRQMSAETNAKHASLASPRTSRHRRSHLRPAATGTIHQ